MAHPTVEMSLKLPIGALMKAAPASALAWDGIYTHRLYDGSRFKVAFRIERRDGQAFAMLAHQGRRVTRDGGGAQRYRVEMAATPMRFGGVRWWWRCPFYGELTPYLYLPLGAVQFRSRRAYRLPYTSQRSSPMERARRKLRRECVKLGGTTDLTAPLPDKPKWMRWATYDRKIAELEPLAERVDEDFARSVMRAFGAGLFASQ